MPHELVIASAACATVAFACWLLSIVTREYSWVDRLWSIVPIGYVAYFAVASGYRPRAVLIAVLVAVWGARLTFNFARKGGYARGGEDYRWAVLRARMPPAAYQVFNVLFIAGYQNLLLLLISAPAFVASQSTRPLGAVDGALTLGFLGCTLGELVADQQQWDFHQAKAARKARGEAGPDFNAAGLWRYSRHPNFFFEQAQWWVLVAFAATSTGVWLQPSAIGAVLLTLLFFGSTRFTEELTLQKYPSYASYQRQTPMWGWWRWS